MKIILLITLVLMIDTNYAQSPKFNNVEIYKDSLLVYKNGILNQNDFVFNVPGSKLLFENNMGKGYRLPLDNMKCLVPDYQSNMPVYKGNLELNKMPNSQIKPVPIPNPFSKNPPVIFTEPIIR